MNSNHRPSDSESDGPGNHRLFAALSENASITMPVQETFWALRFGMLTDQYGIHWMLNCFKEKVPAG